MIGLTIQTAVRPFKMFTYETRLGSVTHLVAPYLWVYCDPGSLRCWGLVQMALHRQKSVLLFRPVQRTTSDGPGLYSTALRRSPEEDEIFGFLTYMFFSRLYSLISSTPLYRASFDGCDALGMYQVGGGPFPLLFGSLPDSLADQLLIENLSPSHPIVIELDERGSQVSSGFWHLQSREKTAAILPGFEDNDVLYRRGVQEIKVVTSETMKVQKKKGNAGNPCSCNHGDQTSFVCWGWFVIESCSAAPSSSPRE